MGSVLGSPAEETCRLAESVVTRHRFAPWQDTDEDGSPAWLDRLRDCPKLEALIWEEEDSGGGSLHPSWCVELDLRGLGRPLRLERLDPVHLGWAADRVLPDRQDHWLRECARGTASWRFGGLHPLEMHACEGSEGRPYSVSTGARVVDREAHRAMLPLDHPGCSVRGVCHDARSNLVMELFTGSRPGRAVLWIWALQQRGIRAQGVLQLIVSMAMAGTATWPSNSWLYVFLSGYRFKGRPPGCRMKGWDSG